jgi:hypothetical protein
MTLTEFINGTAEENRDPEIDDWLIILPQLKGEPTPWPEKSLPPMSIIERARTDTRFNVYSEPSHVGVASYIAKVSEGKSATEFVKKARRSKRAVLVLYRVVAKGEKNDFVSIGFGMQSPINKIRHITGWRVVNADQKDAVVVNV